MKRVGKLLLFTFCFNLLTFSSANAEITSAENVIYEEQGRAYNESNINSIQDSMTVDGYRQNKENPTTLGKSFNSYTGLTSVSSGEQLIIAEIKKGLDNLQTTINLDKYVQYFKDRKDTQGALEYYFDTLYEYPEIFYSDLYVGGSFGINEFGEITSCTLKIYYLYSAATINTMKTNFNNKVQEIKNNHLSQATTALEKEYVIHDYIIQNTAYDYDNYYKNTIPTINHTAYGSLVLGIAVCDGYSKAAKILLRDSGIEAGFVESVEMNHAWNYVKLDGYYYYLDLTWDDPDSGDEFVDYTYFNATSSEMKSGTNPHVWDEYNGYPTATSSRFSFLRDGNVYKRSVNKLYSSDYVNRTYYIHSMDLQGQNKTLINNTRPITNFEVYKNNLYSISHNYDSLGKLVYTVNRLNLTNKSEKDVFTTSGSVQDIYKIGSNLTVQYTEGGIGKTKTISIAFKEDVNVDGVINVLDLATLANSYNAKGGNVKYNLNYDLNSDSIIDIYDITKVSLEI